MTTANTAVTAPQRTAATGALMKPPPTTGMAALKVLVSKPEIEKRINETIGKRTPQFISSMLSLASDAMFRDVEPMSIVTECLKAAVLDLPIEKSLGFAHIVPYAGKASFQLGYKGLIQLAQRTGVYSKMNARAVNAEAFGGYDEVGDPIIDWSKLDETQPAVGYVFAFKTVYGFSKLVYWSKQRVEAHADKFSQAYRYGKANPSKANSPWFTQFDSMALKTAIKDGLTHWGPMSVEAQTIKRAFDAERDEAIDVESTVERPAFEGQQPAALPPAEPKRRGRPSNAEIAARKAEPTTPPPAAAPNPNPMTDPEVTGEEPPPDSTEPTSSSSSATAAVGTDHSEPTSSPEPKSSSTDAPGEPEGYTPNKPEEYDSATWMPDFSGEQEIRESVDIWIKGEGITADQAIEFLRQCGQASGAETSMSQFDIGKLKKLLMARRSAIKQIRGS